METTMTATEVAAAVVATEVAMEAVEVAAATPTPTADPTSTKTGVGEVEAVAMAHPRVATEVEAVVEAPCVDLTHTEEGDTTSRTWVAAAEEATAPHRVARPRVAMEAAEVEDTTVEARPRATPQPTAPSPPTLAEAAAVAPDLTCTLAGLPGPTAARGAAAGADPLPLREAMAEAMTGADTVDPHPSRADTGSRMEATVVAGATAAMEDTNLTCESPIPPLVTKQYCKENSRCALNYNLVTTLHFSVAKPAQIFVFDHSCISNAFR